MQRMRWRMRRLNVQAVVAVLAVAAGACVAGGMWLTRPATAQQERADRLPVVAVAEAKATDVDVRIEGHGTVRAKATVRVVPQVAGRLTAVHPQLTAGGIIPAGEPLLEIERADYEVSKRRAEARLEMRRAAGITAEAKVREIRAELDDARDEYYRIEELLARNAADQRELRQARVRRDTLAARLEAAQAEASAVEAEVADAQAALEQAGLDLARTMLQFDYDVIVNRADLDVGQHVSGRESVAEVYPLDAVEIVVPMEQRRLRQLKSLPGTTWDGTAPEQATASPIEAEVHFDFAGRQGVRAGRLMRIGGSVDAQSRMLSLIVRVDDPRTAGGGPPLLPGMFARVVLKADALEDVVRVPREAVHADGTVWTTRDGRLHQVAVSPVHADGDWVYVRDGLVGGEKIVRTPLGIQTEGMAVRVSDDPLHEANGSAIAEVAPAEGDAGDGSKPPRLPLGAHVEPDAP